MKKIILTLFLILFITGCAFYDEYKMPKEVTLTIKKEEIAIREETTLKDIIDEKNVKILNQNEKLDTKDVGIKNITIIYEYNDRKYKYDASYTVSDLEAPKLLYAPKYRYTYQGEDINLCDLLNYIDNYDENPKCTIEGSYDINEIGTYYLKYSLSDSNNNKKELDFTFDVLDPDYYNDEDYYEENDEENSIYFDDVIKNYKNENTMIGIDVSAWQDEIDFEKVKNDGAEFVIIRIAVSSGPDDQMVIDRRFEEYYKNAKKAGLKIGVYVYTAASSKEEVISQAKFIRKKLNKRKLDFPIAYDFEEWSDVKNYKLTTNKLIDYVDEFYKILSKDGYDVMIYGSVFYLENIWPNNSYKTWIAHYTDKTNYSKDYILWQICNTGVIDGIYGYVDIDIYKKENQ